VITKILIDASGQTGVKDRPKPRSESKAMIRGPCKNRAWIGFARFWRFAAPEAFSGSVRDRKSRAHAKLFERSSEMSDTVETEMWSRRELSTPYVANVVLATEFANSWLSNLAVNCTD